MEKLFNKFYFEDYLMVILFEKKPNCVIIYTNNVQ